MKILVTGVAGQLGYDIVKELNKRQIPCIGVDKADFDITSWDDTSAYINKVQPTAVIHCAAYTAVDAAEDNVELCRKVNVDGTVNIAKACKMLGTKMVYISTDYVFSGEGDKPYEEDDVTGPCNIYGQSKLDGELAVKLILSKYYIVRTSWVFGHHGKNFVETMLKLGKEREFLNVVDDQIGSPTFTEDLAVLLADMIVTDKYCTYHATNEGICSWAEFAAEIMRLANLSCRINPISTSRYFASAGEGRGTSGAGGRVAKRPLNSRLSKNSLDAKGFNRLPSWQDALERFLNENSSN